MTIKLVSPVGLDQIKRWILANFHDNHIAYMHASEGIDHFVSVWASDAESDQEHEIELPAHMSRSGRIEYLKPDMYEQEIIDEA